MPRRTTQPPGKSVPVGAAEIAARLGVRRQTVHTWRHRKLMPEPRWTVSGQPARETSTRRSLGGESRRAAEPPRVSAVILVDTSAWIELLRATGHPPHVSLRHHLERRTPLAATEPIIMELLAGTRTSGERSRLRARLIALPRLTVRGSPTSSRWPNCTASAAAGAPPSER